MEFLFGQVARCHDAAASESSGQRTECRSIDTLILDTAVAKKERGPSSRSLYQRHLYVGNVNVQMLLSLRDSAARGAVKIASEDSVRSSKLFKSGDLNM